VVIPCSFPVVIFQYLPKMLDCIIFVMFVKKGYKYTSRKNGKFLGSIQGVGHKSPIRNMGFYAGFYKALGSPTHDV